MTIKQLLTHKKLIAVGLFIIIGTIIGILTLTNESAAPIYQTAIAEKGTLISTISTSGNITTGNNLAIVTNATGTVSKVYVKNGDTVKQGAKIADITLDQDAQQKAAAAWSSYLSAKNGLANAQAQLWTLQNNAFAANQKFINGAVADELSTDDPNYIQQQATWLAAEAAYKNQSGVIQQAQANVTSAWYNYQQVSSSITAPRSGIVASLSIAPGSVISVQSSSNSSSSPQQVGTITEPNGNVQASVSLSEIDVPKVKPDQKVTMTMDAFPSMTFTGKVLIVNTTGSVSSGVTTYPATIVFDTNSANIYTNMAVTAKIITNIKDGVILIPSTAIKTSNGQSTVQIMDKNNKVSPVTVEVGDSNDTQTVITSGINEGDTVITSTTSTTNTSKSGTGTTSVFGGRSSFVGAPR